MNNPYILILGLSATAGLVTAIWSWIKIQKTRKSLFWPHTQGVVTESRAISASDPRPFILINYKVNEQAQQFQLPTPDASDVTPEITEQYLNQYPVNKELTLFYNPDDVTQCTVKPGPSREDWLIFGIGLITAVFGLVLIIPNL